MSSVFSSKIFSDEWMAALQQEWNNSPEIYMPLQELNFTSKIGYGFKGHPSALGMLSIVNGKVVYAGSAVDSDIDWDLRASRWHWIEWTKSGFGINKLGPAIANNTLEFTTGNYRKMISNLALGQAFMRHFQLMNLVSNKVK